MYEQQKEDRIACFRRWARTNYAVFASLGKYVKIGVLSVGMSIITMATKTSFAHEADSASIYKVVRMDAVDVSGGKLNPKRSVMSTMPIFDRKSEGVAPLQTVEGALRVNPAIDLRERGGKGIQSDISIRGGSFDQTMVMLNGINFTDARTGHQSHSLPVDIECLGGIELIDGVSGVGAFAGAVNLKVVPLYSDYLRAEINGGMHGYYYANLSGNITPGERLSVFGAFSCRHSDGYVFNTDFSNINAYVRMTYDGAKAGFFDFQAGFQDRGFGSNGFYSLAYPNQYEHTRTALGSLRWMKDWGPLTLNATMSYRKNYDRYELFRDCLTEDGSTPPSWYTGHNYHNTDNVGAELWADYKWTAGITSLGADYTYNHIYSNVLGEEMSEKRHVAGEKDDAWYSKSKNRNVVNVWLRHTKQWRRFDVAASGSIDSTPYGTDAMWSVSGGYAPKRGLRLELGATQSMRLPTFTDLYYTAANYVSNLNLVPEKAVTYKMSAAYALRGFSASATVYYRAGRNIIDWVKSQESEVWESQQITKLNTLGTELAVKYTTSGVLQLASLSYGYMHADKKSSGYVSMYALDYMKHKGAASVGVKFLRNFFLTLTGSAFDRNGGFTNRDGEAENYTLKFLLDGRLAWQNPARTVKVYVDVTNILDTEYYDFGGLPLPGTWALGGVSFVFK